MSAHFSANIRRASSLFSPVGAHARTPPPPFIGSGHRLIILALYHIAKILPTKLLLCILTGFDKALSFIFFCVTQQRGGPRYGVKHVVARRHHVLPRHWPPTLQVTDESNISIGSSRWDLCVNVCGVVAALVMRNTGSQMLTV